MINIKKIKEMKSTQKQRYLISLAGKFGVCSELAKRNIHSNITFVNAKSTNIKIPDKESQKSYIVEVKTTNKPNKIVTNFFQKYKTKETPHPDFWVLVHITKELKSKYFILTHKEMAIEQMKRNNMTKWEVVEKGVDNVLIKELSAYENQWDKITEIIK